MDDSSFGYAKTKVTPPSASRLQAAWCCMQQTFTSFNGSESRLSAKSDFDSYASDFDNDFSHHTSSNNLNSNSPNQTQYFGGAYNNNNNNNNDSTSTIHMDGSNSSSSNNSHSSQSPLSGISKSTYALRNLRPLSAVKNFRSSSMFGKNLSLPKSNMSYFPGMNSMYRRAGVPFDHNKYNNHTFDNATDVETDSVSENGEAHLSKLSDALGDQYRSLQANVDKVDLDNFSELSVDSTGKARQASDKDMGSNPNSNHSGSSSTHDVSNLMSTQQHNLVVDEDTMSEKDADAVSVVSSSAQEGNDLSSEDIANMRLKKLTEVVLAQSEVLQLQELHSEATNILEKTMHDLESRIQSLHVELAKNAESEGDDAVSHDIYISNEIRSLNKILLNFYKRLGSINKVRGDLQSAENYLTKSIELLSNEPTFDNETAIRSELSNSFSALAVILDEMGHHDDAMLADQRAIENLASI